jgi:hypothetical protein
MIISIGSKPITPDGLRKLGFALVDLATSVDRYHLQLSQAQAEPGNETERNQADKAATRVFASQRKVRRLLEAATS